jgi:cytochrome c553
MKQTGPTFLLLTSALLASVMFTGYCSDAAAQAARAQADKGADLRAAYANAADVADGKRIADATCAGCHGANGIASMKGVPNLAGQRPVYLYLELKAYQSGVRAVGNMTNVTKPLSDQALVQLAAYYASLEPAQPAAPSTGKAAPAKSDLVQAGKAAAAACAGCHGETGVSKTPGTPSLVGLEPKYLVAAMQAYKSGQRKNDVMKSMLAAVSDADLNNVALYYALQRPMRAQNAAPGDQAAGKNAAAACSGCHGDRGVSINPATPSLAGQDAEYFAAALGAYKDGSRTDETMKGIAVTLDQTTAKNLAAFYANQQPQQTKVPKPLTTAEWVQRCDRCHGVNGNSVEPELPALAAQRQDYLEKVLHAYRTGERRSPQMAAMSDVLTETDVESLAAYYARQKARAVVYVMVPAKCPDKLGLQSCVTAGTSWIPHPPLFPLSTKEPEMKRTLLTIGLLGLLAIIGTAQAAGDAAAGKAKSGPCVGCHGANGEGSSSNPPLAGKSEDALVQALQEYKSGKRSNAIMKSLASKLSDQDMTNLAAYYASLKK